MYKKFGIFLMVLMMQSSFASADTWRLNYDCGEGTAPVPTYHTANVGSTLSLKDSTCTPPNNYYFQGWVCVDNTGHHYGAQPGTENIYLYSAGTEIGCNDSSLSPYTCTANYYYVCPIIYHYGPSCTKTYSGSEGYQYAATSYLNTLPDFNSTNFPDIDSCVGSVTFIGWNCGNTLDLIDNSCKGNSLTPPMYSAGTASCNLTTYSPDNVGVANCHAECNAIYGYSITYDCNGGSGNAPTDNTIYGGNYNNNSTVNVAANSCTAPTSTQTFEGWSCNGTTYNPGDTFTASSNTTCVAQWSAQSCPAGSHMEMSPLIDYINMSAYLSDPQCSSNGCYDSSSGSCCDGLGYQYWATHWKQGLTKGSDSCVVYGIAKLSNRSGTVGQTVDASTNVENDPSGSYCWCRVTGYNTDGNIDYLPWVCVTEQSAGCSYDCTKFAMNFQDTRNAMFYGYGCTVNDITLNWLSDGGSSVSNQNSCKYGALAGETDGINNINHPTKTGYQFGGWRVTNWSAQ